ncbi:hypothetical protein A9R00_02605 [Oleispira antarctica]|uniref:Type II secretion system protein GspE N-terminal domain-containing protein n=1 Tax=Oleispira antarctica TaxID=188908 RepID=A0A1Y5HVK2_OLEAN|nr:hypothetical protein A9R00_02605 [Oleispira antarctica]
MHKRQEIQQKSRLGLLLINKGLITSSQLDQALQLQGKTGMRLGEVLIDQGWISERQLSRSLKKQTRYRYVAAFAALLLGPLQPFMASASIEKDPISTEQVIEKKDISFSPSLTSLTDADMGNVTARGVNDNLARLQDIMAGNQEANNGQNTLETIGSLLLPASDLLDAEVEMSGVTYAKGQTTSLNADGSIQLALPTHIDQIAFKNIRVKGSENEHMGDLFIKDIDLSNMSVSIKVHN